MSVMKYKDPGTGKVKKVFAPTIDTYTKTETYSKTETDTLLSNKAPAGYGLGGTTKKLTSDDDLNNVLECGYYHIIGTETLPTNAPDYCSKYYISLLHVESAGAYGATQEITCARNHTAGTTGIKLRRVLNGLNSWSDWEYVNPPFASGVVYRTTERHFGNPVYKKMDSDGVIWWSTDQSTWKREAERVGAAPAYSYGTSDLTVGSSSLETGTLYFVYE